MRILTRAPAVTNFKDLLSRPAIEGTLTRFRYISLTTSTARVTTAPVNQIPSSSPLLQMLTAAQSHRPSARIQILVLVVDPQVMQDRRADVVG